MTRHALTTAALACASFSLLALQPAAAYEASSVGDRYRDGLDSRHAATSFMSSARTAGYTGTAYTNGRQVDAAWEDGLSAAVIGYFGHANAGYFQIKEGATAASDEFMMAGSPADVVPLYQGFRGWSEYLPAVDVDDVKLAVLAGCYTANTDESTGMDFEEVGAEKGIDTVVAFPGLVYYPASCTACAYSGNYYWERVGAHLAAGRSVSVALANARTELVSKEGSAGGWQSYRVTGSVAAPGNVKIKPAGPGEPLTSEPPAETADATAAYTLAGLTPVGAVEHAGGLEVTDTAEGVTLRREVTTGRLVDVVATASTGGEERLSSADAAERANAFLAQVTGAPELTFDAADAEVASHGEGESLLAFGASTPAREGGTAERVDLEVDRRTGAITYFGWAVTGVVSTSREITRVEAERLAVAELPAGAQVTDVGVRDWDRAYWVVEARAEATSPVLRPSHHRVLIDAADGRVVGRTTT